MLSYNRGKVLNFNTDITGVPEPVVEWYKDGVRAAGGVRAADGASVLQVGSFSCMSWAQIV